MTPDTLLRWVVQLLPAQRREWGLAMQAELAGLERGRWGFALSCARGVLGRPETLLRLVPRLFVLGAFMAAVWLLAKIQDAPVRLEAIAMVSILGVVAWLTRPSRLVGVAALAILGAEGLIFLRGLQGESDATAGIVIWTAMLSIYALALTRAPALRTSRSAPLSRRPGWSRRWSTPACRPPPARRCWPSRSLRSARAAGSPGSVRQRPQRS